jgi:hypothetical protein
VQATVNIVTIRFTIFTISSIALSALAVRFAFTLVNGAPPF